MFLFKKNHCIVVCGCSKYWMEITSIYYFNYLFLQQSACRTNPTRWEFTFIYIHAFFTSFCDHKLSFALKKKNVKYHFWKKKNEERLFIRIDWKYIFSTKFYNLLPRVIDDNPSTLGMFHKSFQITEWRKRWEFIRMFILYKYKTLLPGCIRYWTLLSVHLSLIIITGISRC